MLKSIGIALDPGYYYPSADKNPRHNPKLCRELSNEEVGKQSDSVIPKLIEAQVDYNVAAYYPFIITFDGHIIIRHLKQSQLCKLGRHDNNELSAGVISGCYQSEFY